MPTVADTLIQKGMQQGMQQVITEILQLRFKTVPHILIERINKVKNVDKLRTINRKAVMADSISELAKFLDVQV